MRARILVLWILAAGCTIAFGLRPPPKDHFLVSLKPVFQGDDEQVWQLTIETREPARYRIVSAVIGGGGSLGGNTAHAKSRRGKCRDEVWLVFSQISPSEDGPAYLKTVLRNQSGNLSQTREIARGFKLGDIVPSRLTGPPSAHRLNIPMVLADMDRQRVRLMVGARSDELNEEPGGAPNTALPRR